MLVGQLKLYGIQTIMCFCKDDSMSLVAFQEIQCKGITIIHQCKTKIPKRAKMVKNQTQKQAKTKSLRSMEGI